VDSVLAHLTARFTTQAENLATEALCYLLRSRPPAAAGVIDLARAFGTDLPSGLVFQTQNHAVEDSSIPDLVGVAPGGSTPLVCEIKFWAGLTDNQPVTYLGRLPADEPGLLLFVAPLRREAYLKAELSRRLGDAGFTAVEADLLGPGSALRVGGHTVGIIGWRPLLAAIESRLQNAGDRDGLSDLRQIQGLADRMDEDAFLPLTSEELSGGTGPRIIQLTGLLDDVVTRLTAAGLISIKGLRAAATARWVGRWIRLAGAEALLRVDFQRWGTLAATPLWLRVSGEPGGAAAKALAPLRHFDPPRFFEWHNASQIPLYLPVGADRETALSSLEAELREVHALLLPAGLGAASTPTPGVAAPDLAAPGSGLAADEGSADLEDLGSDD